MMLDIIVVIVTILGFITGYKRGIINTVFDTFSIVIAIVAALKLSPIVITLLDRSFDFHSGFTFLLGFVATFFVVLFLIRFIGKYLEKILKTIKLNSLNKLAGGVLMGGVFSLILGGILLLSNKLKIIPESTLSSSITYPLVSAMPNQAKGVFNSLNPLFQNFWNTAMDTVDDIKVKGEAALENSEDG